MKFILYASRNSHDPKGGGVVVSKTATLCWPDAVPDLAKQYEALVLKVPIKGQDYF